MAPFIFRNEINPKLAKIKTTAKVCERTLNRSSDFRSSIFSSKIHRGMLSNSVSFNDANGENIFKVFVTRNENREIIKDQFDKFIALRDSF
jgi:hypothetical protein